MASFILEDRRGDVLTHRTLWELFQNEEEVRNSDLGTYLYDWYDVDNQRQIFRMFTIADAVQNLLLLDPRTDATLETATDDQVKEAIHRIPSSPVGECLLPLLSEDAVTIPIEVNGETVDSWQAASMLVIVASDDE